MKIKISPFVVFVVFALIVPSLIFADGGMVIWPRNIHLEQSAQNAIVAWNENEEIIILSNNIESDAEGVALRMVPLPSNPSEIKEGSFDSFDELTEIINKKIDQETDGVNSWRGMLAAEGKAGHSPGVEITFHEKIGAHDVTVVKVNDLDCFIDWIDDFAEEKGFSITQEVECLDYGYENCPPECRKDSCPMTPCLPGMSCIQVCNPPICTGGTVKAHKISLEFRKGVENYLKRDIEYFVFDVINAGKGEESINPLIYRFESDYLYYPVLISGVSEISNSNSEIKVFFITEGGLPISNLLRYWYPYQGEFGYQVELNLEELQGVSEDIASLFNSDVKVVTFDYYGSLKYFKKDMVFYPRTWQRNLSLGSRGEDVKALQEILINEGLWDSDAKATGYFGLVTANALAKFQEKHKYQVLKPLNMDKGTGYFGAKTKEFLGKTLSLLEKNESISWFRNLSLGSRGEDVKALQEILINEGLWDSDAKATGYFGPITKRIVVKFQEKHASDVLDSLGIAKGTGFVGPSTRRYLEKISNSR